MSPEGRNRASSTDSLPLCKQWELPDVRVESSAEKDQEETRILDTASEGRWDTKPKTKQPLQGNYVDMYGQIKPGVTDTSLGVTFTAAVPVGAVLVNREITSQDKSGAELRTLKSICGKQVPC